MVRIFVCIRLTIALLLLTSSVSAQIQISVVIRKPTPAELSVWQRDPTVTQISIVNRGLTIQRARLSIEILDAGGRVVAATNDGAPSIPRFTVKGGGATTRLSGRDVIDPNAVQINKFLQKVALQTNALPEGEYTCCVRLLTDEGDEVAGSTEACGDVVIAVADPPQLVSPVLDQEVESDLVQFQWTPVRRAGRVINTQYILTVVPLRDKDSPILAIERNEQLVRKTLQKTDYLLTTFDRRLRASGATRFAWRVQSVGYDNQPSASNNGYSEIGTFSLRDEAPFKRLSQPLPDTVVVGGFTVAVTKWGVRDQVGYSGEGCLILDCDNSTNKRATSFSISGRGVYRQQQCAEVSFSGLRWTGRSAKNVVAVDGVVTYPRLSSMRRTLRWYPSDSFIVEVDTLAITTSGGQVAGKAYHVNAMTGYGTGEPGKFVFPLTPLSTTCDFLEYVTIESDSMYVGETVCLLTADEYTVDFSRERSFNGEPSSNIGIVLNKAHTVPLRDNTMNQGYLCLPLHGSGRIADKGVTLELTNTHADSTRNVHKMAIPFGHRFEYSNLTLRFRDSRFTGGTYAARYTPDSLHRYHSATNQALHLTGSGCRIDTAFTLYFTHQLDESAPRFIIQNIVRTQDADRHGFLFAATNSPSAIAYGRYPVPWEAPQRWEAHQMPSARELVRDNSYVGLLLGDGAKPEVYFFSRDAFGGYFFKQSNFVAGQFVLGPDGISGDLEYTPTIDERPVVVPGNLLIGRRSWLGYASDTSGFKFSGVQPPNTKGGPKNHNFKLSYTAGALVSTIMKGTLSTAARSTVVDVPNLSLSSTADVPSAFIMIPEDRRRSNPWQLSIEPIDTAQSSMGYAETGRGVIQLSGVQIKEPVHFAIGFQALAMEFLANGTTGRLSIDMNSAGQKFDGIPYTADYVQLSPQPHTSTEVTPYLVTAGNLHLPFFGNMYLHVFDHTDRVTSRPFLGRLIRQRTTPFLGYAGSNTQVHAENDLGEYTFSVRYNDSLQSGFIGEGSVRLGGIGRLPASVQITADYACFNASGEVSPSGDVLEGLSTFGTLANVWACGCVQNDDFSTIGAGGRIAANASALFSTARAGAGIEVTLGMRPGITTMWVAGGAMMNRLMADADVHLLMQGVSNSRERYARGTIHLSGTTATKLGGVIIDAEVDFFSGLSQSGESVAYMQGAGQLTTQYSLVLASESNTIHGGFFLGLNVPKSKAWVLEAEDGRFRLRDEFIPNRLTGIYMFGGTSSSLDLLLISGRIDAHLGIGGFTRGVGVSAGVDLHGSILAGLIYGSALVNLQVAGGEEFGLYGRGALQGCLNTVWFGNYCGTANFGAGITSSRGLFVE